LERTRAELNHGGTREAKERLKGLVATFPEGVEARAQLRDRVGAAKCIEDHRAGA